MTVILMPSAGLAVANYSHDAGGFAHLEDHDDFVRLCSVEVGIDEVIAAALRSFDKWDAPLACPSLQPSLELLGNAPQRVPAHWVKLFVASFECSNR